MWETAEYWKDRAAGAIAHAWYKELPAVRARRIKTIEAAKRKQERNRAECEQGLRFWRGEMALVNRALARNALWKSAEANREQIHKLLGGELGNTCGRFNVLPKEGGASWEGWDAWHCLEADETRYKACPSATVEAMPCAG